MIPIQMKPVDIQTFLSPTAAIPHIFLIMSVIQSALYIHRLCIHKFNQPWIKTIPKNISRKFQKAELEFATSQQLFTQYLHCFCTRNAKLSSCHRHCRTHRTENIYSLAFHTHTKKLPTSASEYFQCKQRLCHTVF